MISNIDDQAGYTDESLRMLESKEGQLNAVFACFGSAAQRGLDYEVALENFLVAYNKIFKGLTQQDLEAIEIKLQNKTIGLLLQEFEKYVTVSDSTINELLKNARKRRNFLIHHFFRERQEKFKTEKGRMEMLRELVDIEKELEMAAKLINGIRVAVSERLNLQHENEDKVEEDDIASEALFSIKIRIPE